MRGGEASSDAEVDPDAVSRWSDDEDKGRGRGVPDNEGGVRGKRRWSWWWTKLLRK
jgi:hypothetical protein